MRQKNMSAELSMTKKLIHDLERKIKEQDEHWSNDVALLKDKLAKAKADCARLHTETQELARDRSDASPLALQSC